MRLKYRLPLYFFLVVAVSSGMAYILMRRSAEGTFRTFVFEGDAGKAKLYASMLAGYYADRGGWENLQEYLAEIPRLVFLTLDGKKPEQTSDPARTGDSAAFSNSYDMIRALLSDRIVVADQAGVIVADTSGFVIGTVHPAKHLEHGVPIMVDLEKRGTILVGSMVDSSLSGVEERFLNSLSLAFLWTALASAGLAILLGLLFAARVIKPLAALNAAVRRISSGDIGAAVPIRGRDELTELSSSFNAMTRELARLEEAKKRIIADSAHELRTPVALIQGAVEAMIDGVYPLDVPTLESVHEEILRLSKLIDTLRELELIESGELVLNLKKVDLRQAAAKAVTLFAGTAREKDIALWIEESNDSSVEVLADYLRLGEVIYNLISNAVKYVPAGGKVRLRIARDMKDVSPYAILKVDDSGPGIPIEERDRVFERFYRVEKTRTSRPGGKGLGLAIVSEIVKAHGGSVSIADSDLGGTSLAVRLPM